MASKSKEPPVGAGDSSSGADINSQTQPHFSTNGATSQDSVLDYVAMVEPAYTSAEEIDAEQQAELAEAALLAEGVHDEGNAQTTHKRYTGRFAYSQALGWLHHVGTHWTASRADSAVDRAIVETLTARAQAGLQAGADKHEKLIKFCIPNKSRVQGAKYLLESLVATTEADFDAEPDMLNCKNGVVNLRTGHLQPHSPAQRFTHCTAVEYRPEANSDFWQAWLLETVGSEEIAEWLQLAVGYSLTGHTSEEVLFYLYGPPRAGKGLFTETLLALLGTPLAKEVNFGTFTAQRTGDSQNFDLAPLKAARLIAASESNAYERFNEAKVKALTGGNEVYCAFKHKTHFSYRPQYKIWLSSNQPVNADPDDDAVWGRLRVVEFPTSHLGRENKQLKQRMRSEPVLEGILAWAVAGAVKWYQLGATGLPELESSAKLKEQHRADLDNVGEWITERCTVGEKCVSSSSDLYQNYRQWCLDNGASPKQQRGLANALKRKGFKAGRPSINGRQVRGFYGVKLGE